MFDFDWRVRLIIDHYIRVMPHIPQGINPVQIFFHGGVVVGQDINRGILTVGLSDSILRVKAQALQNCCALPHEIPSEVDFFQAKMLIFPTVTLLAS